MLYAVTIAIISLSFLILIIYTLSIMVYRSPRVWGTPVSFPRVSILKPLKGTDPDLESNLSTYCEVAYPDFEIVFGVDTSEDPALPVIENIRRRYPAVRCSTIITGASKQLNPKIESLAVMAEQSSGTLYWVTDANTRVEPHTLENLMREYAASGAKIIFSPIRGSGSRTFASMMENAYLNLFVSGNIIAGWRVFRKAIIMGKSMLIEKEALNNLGGFLRFREYLAEDFIMGEIYSEHNLYIATNYTWVTNYNNHTTFSGFCARLSRWSKMRYRIEKFFYTAEIIVNPIGIALLSLLYLGSAGLGLLLVSIAGKVLIEYIAFFSVNTDDRRQLRLILLFPVSVIAKDLVMIVLYAIPFFSNTVRWRGRKIRVGARSLICAANRGA